MKYGHGGNIRKTAEIHDIDESAIVDFSANINPLGMSPMAKEAIFKALGTIVNYPDPEAGRLIQALSEYHKISRENILCGNGATELIYLIPRVFKPKSALIVAPAFSEYERALNSSGCKVEHFVLSQDNYFKAGVEELLAAMEKGYDSFWIGNPANPTGQLITKNDLLKIAERAEKLGITLIVDEAFIDFCEEESMKKEVSNFPNLIVLRSMTKFFSLAGLRAGYLFASKNIMSSLLTHKEPWTLNSLAEAAATASLNDHSYIKETKELIKMERKLLMQELEKISFLHVYNSDANYLLLKLGKNHSSDQLQDKLLKERRILIRNCSNYIGLSNHFIRVAVKRRNDNKLLTDALKSLMND